MSAFISDNVAKYDKGTVSILDRRSYPFAIEWVQCDTYEAVAQAIEDMVTQSGGPALAASYGMVSAARAAVIEGAPVTPRLEEAARRLIRTRPTNNHIRLTVSALLDHSKTFDGADLEQGLLEFIAAGRERSNQSWTRLGQYGAQLLTESTSVLTHCWAETGIVRTLEAARDVTPLNRVYCTETRPYLQGARLTADAVADLGFDAVVVTDGMPASLMSDGLIDIVMVGADRVSLDGGVVNKIGTLSIALAAKHFGIPFYVFAGGPDPTVATAREVELEYRDPAEVLHARGIRTATPKAQGLYPAFDITPPDHVTGIITPLGVFAPGDIGAAFGSQTTESRR